VRALRQLGVRLGGTPPFREEVKMNADEQTTSDVKEVLIHFGESFSRRDMGSLSDLIAPDPDVTFIGTGVDEERVGISEIKEQIQRDWAQSESASIDWGRLSVSAQGTVAWVAANVRLKARVSGREMTLSGRITAVMDKRDGRWLIDQLHMSVPMAGQEEGHSFPR
jgi:ketosteroid isomerase-like protein